MQPVWRISLAGIMLLSAIACSDERQPEDAPVLATSPTCGGSDSVSNWAAAAQDYELVAEYGADPGEELVDVWGLTSTTDGTILVWDSGSTRIVRLNRDLQFLGTSGRQGQGPGEFEYQRSNHGNWITTNDSTFLVVGFSRGILSEFEVDGPFLCHPTLAPPFPIPIRGIAYFGDHVIYGVDVIDRDDGSRSLETWRLESQRPHRLLRSDPLPTLPQWLGRPIQHHLQADPLWAASERCIYVADGSSPSLLRADLVEGGADVIVLPDRPIPDPSEEDLALWHDMLMDARSFGVAPKGIETVEPTAPARWADLLVDPGGLVWIEPWRPPSYRSESVTALVVNPQSGVVDSVRLPRFPDAFLPGGAMVALVEELDGFRLEKYGSR